MHDLEVCQAPLCLRMVKASSRLGGVLVGTVAGVDVRAAVPGQEVGAPGWLWRMTMKSGAMASRFLAVSRRVSP